MSTWQTLLLLIFSVFIADGSWSYWYWIAFSIASWISEGDDGNYTLGSYFCGALIGFACNAFFFYYVHNWLRYIAIQILDNEHKNIHLKDAIWRCDFPFALLVFGAYYGFGPFADGIVIWTGANESRVIALCNALGTLLGALLLFLLVYFPPLVIENNQKKSKLKKHAENASSVEMGTMSNNPMGTMTKNPVIAAYL